MWFEVLLKGILVGFLASIPLGPVGVLCIQKTLSKSFRAGFVSGLGAASADFIFAVIAAFFLSFITSFVDNFIEYLKIIGGICVIIVGVNIFLKNPVIQIRKNRANKGNLWSDYISVFLVTLANPAFILMFVALFAAFGLSGDEALGHAEGAFLVAGVFAGASLWWFLITFSISFLRKKFRPRHLLILNRVSGALIVALGAAAILSLFIKVSLVNNIIS